MKGLNLGGIFSTCAFNASMLPFDERDKLVVELVASQPLASSFHV